MAKASLRADSASDNLIPFPTPQPRAAIPFDPTNPVHQRVWCFVVEMGFAELRAERGAK